MTARLPCPIPAHADLAPGADPTVVTRGHIGSPDPRPNARRLLQGRGTYIDDLRVPRLAHVVFLRSPHAHARILKIDSSTASRAPGVLGVFDGPAIAAICKPWVGVLAHLKGIKSAEQYPLAIERACWQGEPVVAIVAETRAQAEDARELIEVQWEVLPAITDMDASLAGDPVLHPELGDNICFERSVDTGGIDEVFAQADVVVEETFQFGRHTGVCPEGRSILADYNAAEHSLLVHHSTQAPHMIHDVLARHFDIPEAQVRVLCHDVGGAYGIKVHVYPDEICTVATSILLRRPVKFVADRMESFVSDIHAREHKATVRLAARHDGTILGIDLRDLTAIGPYSMYPRTSGIEGNQVVNLTGGPYRHQHYRAHMQAVFTNKNVTCQYRAVGHPIAVAITEGIVDLAAERLGIDPAEFRRRNLIPDDAYPYAFPSGVRFEQLSHQQCLDRLLELMDYEHLRADQAAARARGCYRGIGLAAMIEVTNPSAAFYGVGGARISSQDGATVRLEPTGALTVLCSVTEQGQGTETVFAQIAADVLGVSMERVRVITGDTAATPYGGGTWGSRGAGIGGEAVLQSARALRAQVLDAAAAILSCDKAQLDIAQDAVIDRLSGQTRLSLAELGRICYYRPDTLPAGFQSELVATRHYVPRDYAFAFTNGIQASWVEVDIETGFVQLLGHWCVEDCGTVINPLLVDEQIRGGVVQGLGAALLEECCYDDQGQMLNAHLGDYLVPMALEMPDIVCAHVQTPTRTSELGAKGAGEAGTAGAPAAVMNAINDALRPLAARVTAQPFTPERILAALGRV